MLQCTNCARQQVDGKFCGACGSPLKEVETTEMTVDETNHQEEGTEVDKIARQNDSSSDGDDHVADNVNQQERADEEQELPHLGHSTTALKEKELAEQEATATATGQAVNDDVVKTDYVEEAKKYWRYSLDVLKSPGKAFNHKEDKFAYGIINLVLYALTFSLIILSVVRGIYKRQLGDFGSMLGVDATGMFVQMTVYLFIGMSVALLVVLLSLLVAEKTMIKKMTFKEILVQYSGLLIPFIFLQVAVLLFSLIGSSFLTMLIVCISLFYGLFFLTAIFMYEKVTFYQSTPHRVYTAVGTTVFVAVVFAIVTFVFGMSLIENITEMIDDLTYYF